MTVTGEPDRTSAAPGDATQRPARRRDASAVLEVCPYLAADGGEWRSAFAERDHRCQAVQPPAPLAVSKQRQLCLLPAHASCATFLAARALATETQPVTPGDAGAALWPTTVSTPLVLEPARRIGALPGATGRSGGQALLIALMVVAFVVLVIARTQSPGTAAPGGVVDATASASVEPTPTASLAPSPTPEASPSEPAAASPSIAPSTEPTPRVTPRPSASPIATTQTYKVKSGDTLSSIAARFGTTVAVLKRVNDIADARLIHVGQVLQIP